MNERIRILAEQSTVKISFRLDTNTYKHIDDPNGTFERFEFDKQKFAELIIKDCVDLLQKEWYQLNDVHKIENETPRDIGLRVGSKMELIKMMHKIKQHFGVEE